MNKPTELEGLARLLRIVSEHYRKTVGSQVADGCVEAARILQALTEPSEGMIEAGRVAYFDLTGDGKYKPFEKGFSDGFRAAIKHILEEGESE
jgi:hypothetical protein